MSRSRDSSSPCTSSPQTGIVKIRYTIAELMTFKDLPHCQTMPDVQMDPRSVLRIADGPKGKRSARTRNTQPALLAKKERKLAAAKKTPPEDDDDEEILFVPPGLKTPTKPKTNAKNSNSPSERRNQEGEYPGKRQMKKSGLETDGLTAAQLFELERQQARAQFLKSKGLDAPPEPSEAPEESTFFSSAPVTQPLRSLEDSSSDQEEDDGPGNQMDDFFSRWRAPAPSSPSSSAPRSEKPLDQFTSWSLGSEERSLLSSHSEPSSLFATEDSFNNLKLGSSNFASGRNANHAMDSGRPTESFLSGQFESNSSHSFTAPSSQARVDTSPFSSFGSPTPTPPVDDHNPAPLPSEDKLAKATEIGSNLLAMLDRSMPANAPRPTSDGESSGSSPSRDAAQFLASPPAGHPRMPQGEGPGSFDGARFFAQGNGPARGMPPSQQGNPMQPHSIPMGSMPDGRMPNYMHPSQMMPNMAFSGGRPAPGGGVYPPNMSHMSPIMQQQMQQQMRMRMQMDQMAKANRGHPQQGQPLYQGPPPGYGGPQAAPMNVGALFRGGPPMRQPMGAPPGGRMMSLQEIEQMRSGRT